MSTERDARVTKIIEATEQQRELHSLRLKICQEEREQAKKKAEWESKNAELESRAIQLEIKKRELEVKKAEDEAKLANYKLQEFLSKYILLCLIFQVDNMKCRIIYSCLVSFFRSIMEWACWSIVNRFWFYG